MPITEDLDFHYLLGLMPPLSEISEYAWLPELFSTIGHERLIKLCKYAGGEYIRIPTISELSDAIEALQFFYSVDLTHKSEPYMLSPKVRELVAKIREVYSCLDQLNP